MRYVQHEHEAATFMEAFPVEARNFVTAGVASSRIKRTLKQLGINSEIVRKVSIAAYEAELNLVIHSLGGELVFAVDEHGAHLTSKDVGPGIENVDLAMSEGFSTAPESVRQLGFGAGMGLPNMKRCADHFSISSSPAGTEISMSFLF